MPSESLENVGAHKPVHTYGRRLLTSGFFIEVTLLILTIISLIKPHAYNNIGEKNLTLCLKSVITCRVKTVWFSQTFSIPVNSEKNCFKGPVHFPL